MARTTGRTTARRRAFGGQSLTEFALLLPLLSLILLGTIDLARVFFSYQQLTNAVKEGALFASHAPSASPTAPNPSAIQAVVQSEGGIGTSIVNITVTCYSGLNGAAIPCAAPAGSTQAGARDTIVVSAQYQFRPITSQILRFFPSGLMLRKTVRTMIL